MRMFIAFTVLCTVLLCTGCGGSRENARVGVQQRQGIEAAHQVVIAQGELLAQRSEAGETVTPEEQLAILQNIGKRLRLAFEQAGQLVDHLSIGLSQEELAVNTSVDEAREDFDGFAVKAQQQLSSAREETQRARMKHGLLAWLGKVVDGLAQNWLGFSLGLGGTAATGVALWAVHKYRKIKKVAVEIAKVGGELLGAKDPDEASRIKEDAEARQTVAGIQKDVAATLAKVRTA